MTECGWPMNELNATRFVRYHCNTVSILLHQQFNAFVKPSEEEVLKSSIQMSTGEL